MRNITGHDAMVLMSTLQLVGFPVFMYFVIKVIGLKASREVTAWIKRRVA